MYKRQDFDPSKLSADDTAYIQETGEFVFGKNVAASIKDNDKKLSVTYVKTGFDSSDARPEYYYNCKDITNAVTLDAGGNVPHDAAGDIIYSDPSKVVDFKFSSQEIKYTVANSTDITVNTPVSYTHLDVYKRQMIHRCFRMYPLRYRQENQLRLLDRQEAERLQYAHCFRGFMM